MKRLLAFPMVLLLSGLATSLAQSLAEIAEKEKERRKKIGQTQVQSFGDTDLRDYRGELPVVSTRAGEASAEGSDESEEPDEPNESEESEESLEGEEEEEDPTQTEAYWRDRLAGLNRRIADLEAQLNQPGFAQDPSNLLRRQRLERDLAQARSQRDGIIQEGRRAGVPPGWLR